MAETTIQEQLRDRHHPTPMAVRSLAADRIDALEAALAEILAIIDEGYEATCELEIEDAQRIARKALGVSDV
jgi:hypothetical protein